MTPIEGVERGIGLDGYSELEVSSFSDNLCCCEMKREDGMRKKGENVVKREEVKPILGSSLIHSAKPLVEITFGIGKREGKRRVSWPHLQWSWERGGRAVGRLNRKRAFLCDLLFCLLGKRGVSDDTFTSLLSFLFLFVLSFYFRAGRGKRRRRRRKKVFVNRDLSFFPV